MMRTAVKKLYMAARSRPETLNPVRGESGDLIPPALRPAQRREAGLSPLLVVSVSVLQLCQKGVNGNADSGAGRGNLL